MPRTNSFERFRHKFDNFLHCSLLCISTSVSPEQARTYRGGYRLVHLPPRIHISCLLFHLPTNDLVCSPQHFRGELETKAGATDQPRFLGPLSEFPVGTLERGRSAQLFVIGGLVRVSAECRVGAILTLPGDGE